MITLEMGQLYGMNSGKELMQTIKELKNTGMSDNDIQVILDRSKAESEDAISRKEALEALEKEEPLVWCDGADEIAAYNQWSSDVDTIKNIPSVQPKYNADEWCRNCSEYNHDKHYSYKSYNPKFIKH